MVEALKKHSFIEKRRGPVVLCIMDGVGYGKYETGDAYQAAITETLDELTASCPVTKLQAHGVAVGLPSDDDMGNSEVGHNAIGCGRVFAQGAKLVAASLESGAMFTGDVWKKLTGHVAGKDQALHFIGLLSDGNVHSHVDHLEAMVKQAKNDGVKTVRVHALLDGRDVGETSALDFFDPLEKYLADLSDDSFDARIASGGGRMQITMDRYNADWSMVERGWNTHVLGEGELFDSAHDAIVSLRERTGAIDQDLPPFIVAEDGVPLGAMEDGDSVILFNFRGDRALEITAAFEKGDEFDKFDRVRVPAVEYAGMMEYDGDLHVPAQYLVNPPTIDRTMAEYLCATGVKQYSISETQKFGHVTYFFNGNKTGKFSEELETYVEVLSDVVPFEQRPAMKCAEITDKVIETIEGGEYELIKLNFPNGDMVGHTGVFQAVVCSMEAMDLSIGRIRKAVEAAGGVLILTADHGNSDDMFEHDKKTGEVIIKENGKPKSKTSHSLNPVPCIIYDPEYKGDYSEKLTEGLGISSVCATTINLLGYEAPADYDVSVFQKK
ncbi:MULTISPECIES: 2,3-bisphosphoglycerate-independent phosphoglycerate mutase [unclassified Oceanispirochaeta]|uniref:2,3-bisphosphoglycerate-independent phosphoglycerate mutase n=1 Tax=unclassified Oceanispirochaeta TaxID=2635722 RepID=UPI000E09AA68|nr:2,3-bisphosphoglycerate-independent phosphoglycerate mutase [Oceanispirochaeta sp. M1]MBF9018418.1 2,3-bisphosphoglycerate-independent phosphoglycerate mutase [Oceanispirochaeta sp. M2]NPD74849.1 2,3-bisphosphoglycerate-independent phosphoglycerate mutase [Oceanispirochaeta sp. M1]RDG29291.1 2,3-bisphosphoglycerate-independent phosphoglycerate mutase [Oceanispirochaeta sp. M1]